MKTKDEFNTCDTCGREVKNSKLMNIKTKLDSYIFCIDCLKRAYHHLQQRGDHTTDSMQLLMQIKKHLKRKGVLRAEYN